MGGEGWRRRERRRGREGRRRKMEEKKDIIFLINLLIGMLYIPCSYIMIWVLILLISATLNFRRLNMYLKLKT